MRTRPQPAMILPFVQFVTCRNHIISACHVLHATAGCAMTAPWCALPALPKIVLELMASSGAKAAGTTTFVQAWMSKSWAKQYVSHAEEYVSTLATHGARLVDVSHRAAARCPAKCVFWTFVASYVVK